jgi:hypothetical protein
MMSGATTGIRPVIAAAGHTAEFSRSPRKLLALSEIAGIVPMQSVDCDDCRAISPLSASLLDAAFW